MKILSVESAALVASAAVCEDDKLLCEIFVNTAKTHSQTLMPMIDSVLEQSETTLSDIDLIAVSNGPGSFTGLRIGVSAVKGLAHAKNLPVVGISSLYSMAYNLPFCQHLICPIMDARRNQVYNAVYEWESDNLNELISPRALGIDELLEELIQKNRKVVFIGDGVLPHKEHIINTLGDMAVFAPPSASLQRASALAAPARILFNQQKTTTCYELSPVYLRKSQAEREAEEKEKGEIK